MTNIDTRKMYSVVILLSLLLILSTFPKFFQFFIVDFEQLNGSWVH